MNEDFLHLIFRILYGIIHCESNSNVYNHFEELILRPHIYISYNEL